MRFLSRTALVFAFALAFAFTFVTACASIPWANMSQTDIESWKGLGYGPEQAQELADNGIDPATAAEWQNGGIMGWESIEAWQEEGMSPAIAGAWNGAGFSSEHAGEWAEQKFEPSEAEEWREAGHSLGEAADARGQGLMPIPAVATPSEESSE